MIAPRGQPLPAGLHEPFADAFFSHGPDQPFDFSPVAESQNAFDDQDLLAGRINGGKIVFLEEWGGAGRQTGRWIGFLHDISLSKIMVSSMNWMIRRSWKNWANLCSALWFGERGFEVSRFEPVLQANMSCRTIPRSKTALFPLKPRAGCLQD